VPWEPDHRCRGKDQKHIIEAHYDSDDEVCEDGAIDVDLGQSDDDSDSCTEASDSDSCTEADDTSTLEEDGDLCVVDRQSEEQDDNTCIQQTYHILLMTLHPSRVVTLVRTHTC
jgi:hypothetical protein